jgi:hypothetical protein
MIEIVFTRSHDIGNQTSPQCKNILCNTQKELESIAQMITSSYFMYPAANKGVVKKSIWWVVASAKIRLLFTIRPVINKNKTSLMFRSLPPGDGIVLVGFTSRESSLSRRHKVYTGH